MNRKQLIQRQQELLNTAKAAARELTAEEQAEFDGIQRQLDSMGSDGGDGDGDGDPVPVSGGERSVPENNGGAERSAIASRF